MWRAALPGPPDAPGNGPSAMPGPARSSGQPAAVGEPSASWADAVPATTTVGPWVVCRRESGSISSDVQCYADVVVRLSAPPAAAPPEAPARRAPGAPVAALAAAGPAAWWQRVASAGAGLAAPVLLAAA